jgi:hypothetical protein
MTVTMEVSAERYIDDLVPTFDYAADGGYIPDYIMIPVSVTTTDSNGNSVTDDFVIEITGSGQTKADVCDWSLLTISEYIADEWEYDIGEDTLTYKEILVTTYLSGVENLSTECFDQIYMSLDVKLADGVWMEIWSSISYEYDYDYDNHTNSTNSTEYSYDA